MKPSSNARPYPLPASLFIFIWACLKAEEAGENANTKPPPAHKKAPPSDLKPAAPEQPTIEEMTARAKAYTPPQRRKTQEERAAEILKRLNK